MKIIGEKIIVKPLTLEANGIIIPETLQEHPTKGKVVGIGNKMPEELSDLQIDDIVIWFPYAGSEVIIDNKKFLAIRPNDVVMIEENILKEIN